LKFNFYGWSMSIPGVQMTELKNLLAQITGLDMETQLQWITFQFAIREEPRTMDDLIEDEHNIKEHSGVSATTPVLDSKIYNNFIVHHKNSKNHIIHSVYPFFCYISLCTGVMISQWLTLSLGTLSDASSGVTLQFSGNGLAPQPS